MKSKLSIVSNWLLLSTLLAIVSSCGNMSSVRNGKHFVSKSKETEEQTFGFLKDPALYQMHKQIIYESLKLLDNIKLYEPLKMELKKELISLMKILRMYRYCYALKVGKYNKMSAVNKS